MTQFATEEEIYSFMMERERKGGTLYRFAAAGVADREAKALLEKLAQRCDAYLERLGQSRERGGFESRPCTLPDRNYAENLEMVDVGAEARVPEVLIFAIGKERIGHQLCREGAQRATSAATRKLWLALAEEERRQRLELEAYYEKEVISRI